jgi:hypothetical protein
MSLLFHPRALSLLSKYKKNGNIKTIRDFLVLILDNTSFFDIQFIFEIIFSHTKLKEDNSIEEFIKLNFVKKSVKDVYICYSKRQLKSKYKSLIIENRFNEPSVFGDIGKINFIDQLEIINDLTTNTPQLEHHLEPPSSLFSFIEQSDQKIDVKNEIKNKKKASLKPKIDYSQLNVLNFIKTTSNKSEIIEKFSPLELKNASFVYDRNSIVFDTQRKRDDLVNPVNLQFIKHFDSCKLPIYRKKGLLKHAVYSDRKIPEVLSYDDDSSVDWEDDETEETITEESEEVADDAGDEEWVEKDSEDVEVSRYNKKPFFTFQNIPTEIYFNKNAYINANLVQSDNFNAKLLQEFINFKNTFDGSSDELPRRFGNLFNVNSIGVNKMIKIVSTSEIN